MASVLALPLSTVSERIRAGLRRLERPFRRAGLGGPGGLLAAIAASAVLLEPGRGLEAAAVYAHAQQALAAGTPAAASAAPASAPVAGPIAALRGILVMKVKIALALAIVLAALAALLIWKIPPAAAPIAQDVPRASGSGVAAAPQDAGLRPDGGAVPAAAVLLAVEVVWANDGGPVAGAEVRVRDAGPAARTGDDGRCRFEVPAASGRVQLTARHAHAPAVSRDHNLREGEALRISSPATSSPAWSSMPGPARRSPGRG